MARLACLARSALVLRLMDGLTVVVMVGLVAGCANHVATERLAQAKQIASQTNWREQVLVTDSYALLSFGTHSTTPINRLTIYVEGDGDVWTGGQYPSDDPTPKDPLALRLAIAQPTGTAIYLARPCQYLRLQNAAICTPSIWTSDRFSIRVIDAMNQALDQIKASYGAMELVMVGYSGGARVALELAARRDDIVQVVTVGGNLDPHRWAATAGMLPLNPGTDTDAMIMATQHIAQIHLVGDKDTVVAKELTAQFIDRFNGQQTKHTSPSTKSLKRAQIEVIHGNSHTCCWVEQWPAIWNRWSVLDDSVPDK